MLLHIRDNRNGPGGRQEKPVRDSQVDLEQALLAAARYPRAAVTRPECTPTLEEAYAIQRRVALQVGQHVMVWKLGLTGPSVREAFGACEPTVGRLPASAIYSDRSEIDFVGSEMFAEAELVFELGQDLPRQTAPYSRADLCTALTGIHCGIEIVRTRFDSSDLTLPLLVADNSMAHGLVLGRKLASGWEGRFADIIVTLTRNDDAPVTGSTSRVMDDPLDALVWLANWLRDHEEGVLKRGQLIASGTCTGATEVFDGDTISVSIDGAEAARVSLGAKT